MVDRITKLLRKLSARDRLELLATLRSIAAGELAHLDVKKLQGATNAYRVREGKFRIIFVAEKFHQYRIIAIERRSDTTYRKH